MNSSDNEAPERLLSAALRAQAVGGASPGDARPAEPTGSGKPSGKSGAGRLPVFRVLFAVLVLGLLAGAVAGYFSL